MAKNTANHQSVKEPKAAHPAHNGSGDSSPTQEPAKGGGTTAGSEASNTGPARTAKKLNKKDALEFEKRFLNAADELEKRRLLEEMAGKKIYKIKCYKTPKEHAVARLELKSDEFDRLYGGITPDAPDRIPSTDCEDSPDTDASVEEGTHSVAEDMPTKPDREPRENASAEAEADDARQETGQSDGGSPSPSSDDPELHELAKEIMGCIRKSAAALIEAGQKLLDAKEKLDKHGKFGSLLALIGIEQAKANRLMKIAKHQVLANSMNSSKLPGTEETLLLLSRMKEDAVQSAIDNKKIRPDMSIQDAKQLLGNNGVPKASGQAVGSTKWLELRESGLRQMWENCPDSARNELYERISRFVEEIKATLADGARTSAG